MKHLPRVYQWIAMLCLLVPSLSMGGPAPISEDLPTDMARILGQRKIVVAMHVDDGAPFYTLDKNGRLFGLDVELAYDIARSLGIDVEFKREAKTFDEVVDMVFDRKADIGISCISRTRKRAVKVGFSTPYVRLHHGLLINRVMVSRLQADLSNEKWLNSSKVALGTVRGSSFVEYAQRDYPNVQLIQYASFDEAAADVMGGKIHAALYDDSIVSTWANDHPEEMLYVRAKVLTDKEDPLAIAVHWKDTHLLAWLNIYLDSATKDGTIDKLVAVYLESNDWKEEKTEAKK